MPIIESQFFQPPLRQVNGHLQTIIPSFFRQVTGVTYQRERIATPDDDFLDIDWASPHAPENPMVLVSHGLEGNTSRHYVAGTVKLFNQAGWNACAWNYRSCSGEMNRKARFYHHADTPDLSLVIQHIENRYPQCETIFLVGFSLGGSLTLRYLGEKEKNTGRVKGGVGVSVPCDLQACAYELEKPTKLFYNKRFYRKLKEKIELKAQQIPNEISIEALVKYNIKSCRLLDEHYTAPLHGFASADDFYQKASCKTVLRNIQTPALLLNAKNDPFLAGLCYPKEIAQASSNLYLEMPEKGGHTGFQIRNQEFTYAEQRALAFALAYAL